MRSVRVLLSTNTNDEIIPLEYDPQSIPNFVVGQTIRVVTGDIHDPKNASRSSYKIVDIWHSIEDSIEYERGTGVHGADRIKRVNKYHFITLECERI